MRSIQGSNEKAALNKFAIRGLFMATVILHLLLAPIDAQVVTDGTVGPAVSLPGPDYQIGVDLGRLVGGNLFHSFTRFSVGGRESALFTGPDDIRNVISRVTGGDASIIDGLIRSEVGRADFYFINPAGVVFGENARVDVPAAFHSSTADELRFSDGALFSAADPEKSSLTSARPEAFGFLSPQPASITVNGSVLEFGPGKTASLTAGDLTLVGNGESPARLVAEGGEIRLIAVGQTMENCPVSGETSGNASGVLGLTHASVSTGGDGGGLIILEAGEARLTAAGLSADNTGSANAVGGVHIKAGGDLALHAGAHISADAYGTGDAGDVTVEAQDVAIDGQGQMDRQTCISSSSHSEGHAGAVTLKAAGSIQMVDGVTITSSAFGSGDAGSVKVEAARLLEMVDSVEISSNTSGEGNAGSVTIKTTDLSMRAEPGRFAGIISITEAAGAAGTVDVKASGVLEMIEKAEISSSTFSSGDAGSVRIEAGDLRIDKRELVDQFTGIASIASSGKGGAVVVKASKLIELRNGGSITASSFGSGDAGNVIVETPGSLHCIGGSEISSNTFGSGDGGEVRVNAGNLWIDGQGLENVYTVIGSTTHADGNAGAVEVNAAGMIEIVDKAEISTSTFGSGHAGSVGVAARSLVIDGRGLENKFTGVASLASTGDGGTVDIHVGESLEIVGGAQITCAAYGSGDAGNVRIEAGDLRIDGDGLQKLTGIASTVDPWASGLVGDMEIRARDVELLNGGAISNAHM
ncbi:MAG: filamentous hemagglutinin N-terminal domain-containing protein, partial [Desulfobacterales bacterium]|nr:filamentous hemagglutinin N-terminal domain-containing protein [Desulfobacterales bacterium]